MTKAFSYRTSESYLPDLQADYGHLRRERDRIGLPGNVTFGEFDANLNTGRIAAHCEWKCIDDGCYPAMDWSELRQNNIGQYLNYHHMCRMSEPVDVMFEIFRDGKVYRQLFNIRAQVAVLIWHTSSRVSDLEGSSGTVDPLYDFCSVRDVAAYQVMYFAAGNSEAHYTPVISGYGDSLSWQNFIMRFYGVYKDPLKNELYCVPDREAISLINGQDLHNTEPGYFKEIYYHNM